jgi:hypothetical protein
MPDRSNQRHERFAQLLAEGLPAAEAHAKAGYKPNRGNAAQLAKHPDVQARLKQINTKAAESAGITLELLLADAKRIQDAAEAKGQYAAAASTLKLRAELSGNYVKRVEDVSPKRSQEQIDAELRELLADGYAPETDRASGGTAQSGSSQPGQKESDRIH